MKLYDTFIDTLLVFTQSTILEHGNLKKNDLFALRCNTAQYGLRSIHYSSVRIWNSLQIEIRESLSLSIFKKKLFFLLVSYKI